MITEPVIVLHCINVGIPYNTITEAINVALLLYPGLGLSLSECKHWQSYTGRVCAIFFYILVLVAMLAHGVMTLDDLTGIPGLPGVYAFTVGLFSGQPGSKG